MEQVEWQTSQQEFQKAMEEGNFPIALMHIKKMENLANKEDNTLLKILTQFGYSDFYIKQELYKKADYALHKGLNLADKEQLIEERINGLERKGKLLDLTQSYQKSMECYEQALTLADEHKLIEMRNRLLVQISNGCIMRRDYEKANQYYDRILEVAEKENNDYLRMKGISGKGKTYFANGDMEATLDQYAKAEELAKKLNDKLELSIIQGNRAGILAQQFEYEKAINQYEETIPNLEELKYERGVLVSLTNQATLLAYLGRIEESRDYLDKALIRAQNIHDRPMEEMIYQTYAYNYFLKSQYTEALEYLNKALEVNQITQIKHSYINTILNRADVYCLMGEWYKGEKDFTDGYNQGFSIKNSMPSKIRGLGGKGCVLIYRDELNEGKSLLDQSLSFSDSDIYLESLAPTAELGGVAFKHNSHIAYAKEYYEKALQYYKRLRMQLAIERCKKAIQAL
jgi:tetratricopeptide (TPR) repeat protein